MSSENVSDYHLNPIRKSFYFIEAYILYFLVAMRVRRYGLKKAVTLCTNLRPFNRLPGGMLTEQFVLFTRDLTYAVLKWHLLSNSCVPDSLLPCWFLARRGIKADFVIVIRHFPFMAHAQASWNDIALTDPPPEWSMPGKFVTLMRK